MTNIKNRYILTFVSLALLLTVSQIHGRARASDPDIHLSLKADKTTYSLGDAVRVDFLFRNRAANTVSISKPSVTNGNLRLFIASDGGLFREYVGPGWGVIEAALDPKVELKPDGLFETETLVLFNHRVQTENLTPLYAERSRKELIDTDVAMPIAGRYWLRAVFSSGKHVYESEAVAIEVSEPIGDDAVIWHKIKADKAFAYFFHTGEVKYDSKSVEARKFLDELERLYFEIGQSDKGQKIGDRLVELRRTLDNRRNLGPEN